MDIDKHFFKIKEQKVNKPAQTIEMLFKYHYPA